MKLFSIETQTLLTENHDIVTIKKIFGYSFQILDLPLIAIGLSEEAVITMNAAMNAVILNQTSSGGQFITSYQSDGFSFERGTLSSFGISSSAKISGISDEGLILIKDGSDFAVISFF